MSRVTTLSLNSTPFPLSRVLCSVALGTEWSVLFSSSTLAPPREARGEIPVAQEVPEEPRPDFGDPSVDLGQKWVEAITLRLEAAIARWKMPK